MTDATPVEEGTTNPHVAIRRISHELRTPLTVVIGFCELLQDERPDDDSVKEFASRISANAWLLHSAVERLITELHNAEYTGPPDDDLYTVASGPGWGSPDSLFASDHGANGSLPSQIGSSVGGDDSQVAE